MIKIYSMNTCPDCIYVEEQIQGDDRYEIIDIGSNVKYLKDCLIHGYYHLASFFLLHYIYVSRHIYKT